MSDARGTTDPYLAVDRATEGVRDMTQEEMKEAEQMPARTIAYSPKEDYQHQKVILDRFGKLSPHAKRYVLSLLQDMT